MRKISKRVRLFICIMVITLVAGTIPAQAAGDATQPALGQICLFAFNSAPYGWMECDGRTLRVQQYAALHYLLGDVFGGNDTYFNLPDLSSKAPIPGTKYYIAVYGMFGIDFANPAIGEVCLLPDSIASGSSMWKLCDGSSLNIGSYSALYSLITTSYGGTSTTFKVPNLSTKNPINRIHYYIAVDGTYPTEDGINNEAYIGSIDLYAFAFVPQSTYQCNGQTISVDYNGALYGVIGNTFGGDGSNFAMPNLVGLAPSFKMKYCMRSMGIYPQVD